MARKWIKVLTIVALGGATMFQAGSCDTMASSFLQGVEAGYQAETGESLFGQLGSSYGSENGYYSDSSDWGYADWSFDSPPGYGDCIDW